MAILIENEEITMSETLDKYIEHRIISMIEDYEIIKRSMQQNFIAQMNQNLGYSMRCGQQLEKGVLKNHNNQLSKTSQNIDHIDNKAQMLDLSKIQF